MVDNGTILAWAAIAALGVSVLGLYLKRRKDLELLDKLQTAVDAQREAIAVLGTIAKAQKKAVKIQQDQLNLNAGITLLRALGILDKDGRLIVDLTA
ncbi:MAG: hypothetical protein MUO81_09595 [Thermoplasmata archaeon]|nr:hypothetical protein [Thermoplasmata archaeon]